MTCIISCVIYIFFVLNAVIEFDNYIIAKIKQLRLQKSSFSDT